MAEERTPELSILELTGQPETLLKGAARRDFEQKVVPQFIATRRWFGAKGQGLRRVTVRDFSTLPNAAGREVFLLPRVCVELANGDDQTYFAPLAVEEDGEEASLLSQALARVRGASGTGLLYGAASSPDFTVAVLKAMREGREIGTDGGSVIRFAGTTALREQPEVQPSEVRRLGAEQSNTSIAIGQRMMLKLYRRLQPGIHPEVEVGRFLTEVAGFRNAPTLFGYVEHVDRDDKRTALAILQAFVPNQGDAWEMTLKAVKGGLEKAAPPEQAFADYLPYAEALGRRTAQMHLAFAIRTDDAAFAAESFGPDDLGVVTADARALGEKAFAAMGRLQNKGGAVGRLLERRVECLGLVDRLAAVPKGAIKTRVHGDYHLGQVLVVGDDVMIVDFEGEPSRPASERRAKSSPWRDVAGMLRSFDYAAAVAAREGGSPQASQAAIGWRDLTVRTFMEAYEATVRGSAVWIEDAGERRNLLRLHVLAKALYEINYEANNRPDWIETPVQGVLSIMDEEKA